MKSDPRDVDEYIANSPEGSRAKLAQLRAIIKEVAPEAKERISYGMPSYGEKGRMVYFGIAKSHIGLYGISAPVIEEYKEEVRRYLASKGTIRLPLDEGLPVELIRKMVRSRMQKD